MAEYTIALYMRLSLEDEKTDSLSIPNQRLILRENVLRILVSLLATLASCALFAYVAYDVVFNDGMITPMELFLPLANERANRFGL